MSELTAERQRGGVRRTPGEAVPGGLVPDEPAATADRGPSQLNTAFSRESAFLGQSGTLILGLIQVAVLLVGGYMIIVSDGRDLAPGALVAFYIVLNQLLSPIGQVSTASQSIAGASASVERAASLLRARSRRTARAPARSVRCATSCGSRA